MSPQTHLTPPAQHRRGGATKLAVDSGGRGNAQIRRFHNPSDHGDARPPGGPSTLRSPIAPHAERARVVLRDANRLACSGSHRRQGYAGL